MLRKPDQTEVPRAPDDFIEQPPSMNEEPPLSSTRQDELIEKLQIAEKDLSFLGLVVASSAESIVTVDFDSIITTWNPSAERLYGYPASEAIGKPLTMLTLPTDLQQVLANIESIKESREVKVFDTVRVQKGGEHIDLEILMSPVTSADGKVIGAATIARDITERVRLAAEREASTSEREASHAAETERKETELEKAHAHENQLAESQMHLAMELAAAQHLQEVSTLLIGTDNPTALYERILDSSLQIMRAQHASIQLLFPERGTGGELWLIGYRGFTPEAAKYWEWVSLDSEGVCGQALRTGERVIIPNIEADKQMIGSEDRAIYSQAGILAVQTTPLVSRGGRLLGMISTHWNRPHTPTDRDLRLLDVLARQVADLIDRNQAEEIIRQSEEKYRTLFESIDEGFCLLEILFDEAGEACDYVFLEANAAFEKQSGLVGAVGRSILDLVPELEPQWAGIYGRVATTGEPVRFDASVTSMDRIFDIYAFPGGPYGENKVAVIFNDITERKRHEANIAFLADVSNDLVSLTTIDETMNALGAKMARHFRASMCSFLEIDVERGIGTVLHEWHAEDAVSLIGEYRIADYGTEEQLATWRSDKPFVLRDAESDERVNAEALAAFGIGSYLSIPIARDGQWRYLLTVYDRVARDWREDEIDLMRDLTSRIWTRLERARAEETLRLSEGQLQVLLDETPMGVYLIDADFRILAVNPTALPVFAGIPDLIGRDFEDVIHRLWSEEYADEVVRLFRHTLETGERYYTPERIEERQDLGVIEYYEWQINRIPLPDGRDGVVCYFRDVSAQVFARLELAASEEKYRTLFESIDEAFCTIEVIFDEKGKAIDYLVLETNPAFVRQSGLEDAVGKTMREIAPTHEEFWYDTYGHVAKTGEPKRLQHEAAALGKFFDVYAFRIGEPAENRVAVIFNDITERKRAEEELRRSRESLGRRVEERTRELAEMNTALQTENLERRKVEAERVGILQRLVTAQEDVRRRIGRDLHDQLGQHVTALRFKLEAAAKMSGANPEIKDQITDAQEYAKKVDADVEFLTFELRPTALDDLGLTEAIGIFVREWSQNHNVAAEFYARPFDEELPSEAEINVYRIVQEALNNTLKHAMAKSVTVHLYVQDGSLVLIIEDDGIGFDLESIATDNFSGAGLGLIGMRERCLLVGGNLEIESAPGKGTVIFARIPVKSKLTPSFGSPAAF